ncbi:MAG: glycosyltransferase family A protein [Gemmataceae bacterium]
MTAPDIFIAVPVFRGAELAPETLRSIRDQTYPHFRVWISIDDNDIASAAACQPFTADPRFTLTIQPTRLGWAGNLNWLARRCDCPFFCYWQQDDLTATNYLATLRAELLVHPQASVAYSDLQWFGHRFDRQGCPSLLGSPLERMFQFVESLPFEPLRGLMRTQLWPADRFLDETFDHGSHAEFSLLTHLVGQGEFRRVDSTLYFKRAHAANTFAGWNAWPESRRRRLWMHLGASLFHALRDHVPDPAWQRRLFGLVLDRFTVMRPGRGYYAQTCETHPPSVVRAARDLLDQAGLAGLPPPPPTGPGDGFARPIHPVVLDALDALDRDAASRQRLAQRLQEEGSVTLDTRSHADGLALLGHGWSIPEEWGLWSDGESVSLLLPPGVAKLELQALHYPSAHRPAEHPCRVDWSSDGPTRVETLPPGKLVRLTLPVAGATRVVLRLPDAVDLSQEPLPQADSRRVAIGLHRLTLSR